MCLESYRGACFFLYPPPSLFHTPLFISAPPTPCFTNSLTSFSVPTSTSASSTCRSLSIISFINLLLPAAPTSTGYAQLRHFAWYLLSAAAAAAVLRHLTLTSGCPGHHEWLLKENPPLRSLLHQWVSPDWVLRTPASLRLLRLQNQLRSRNQGCCAPRIHRLTPVLWRLVESLLLTTKLMCGIQKLGWSLQTLCD